MKKISEKFPFHELNLEDCLSKIQIPKIDRYEDHAFVIAKKFILITSSAEKYGDSFYPTLTVANSL
jgi:Mg2+ and Co2+ transporter CorA